MIIEPLAEYGVIIYGGVGAARDEVARRLGSRPMHNVGINGYGSVHATVWTDDTKKIEDWFGESLRWPHQPGDLLFYNRHHAKGGSDAA